MMTWNRAYFQLWVESVMTEFESSNLLDIEICYKNLKLLKQFLFPFVIMPFPTV